MAAVVGLLALLACALAALALFGRSETNWLFQHARELARAAQNFPAESSVALVFWFVTIPTLIFSPLGEEFLFRGYLLTSLASAVGATRGLVLQAAAFSIVHLSHYGLRPLSLELIPLWVASMFGVGWVLGWLVRKSGSLWTAVIAHAVFNLSMNAVTFMAFPHVIALRGVAEGAV